jgi:hypothetical protein
LARQAHSSPPRPLTVPAEGRRVLACMPPLLLLGSG